MRRVPGLPVVLAAVAGVLLSWVPPAPVQAADADAEAVRRGVQSGRLRPLADILAEVQKTHPGRVLDVDLERDDRGRLWYEIKLLAAEGHRLELRVDAATGQEIDPDAAERRGWMPLAAVLQSVLERHPGVVRHAELEQPLQGPAYYDVTLERSDGSAQRYVVDAREGRVLDRAPMSLAQLPPLQPLPGIVRQVEQRYGGRAVEVELKLDARQQPYYEVELRLPGGRGLEVDVDAVTGVVRRAGE